MQLLHDAYGHCEALVRQADKDRFLAALFAPAEGRRHLFALYAFNVEISRVREVVREPLPGEIRLQWWRDALRGAGEAVAHPVARALLDTIAARALASEPLARLIDAHAFDLYDDPMPSLAALEEYACNTASVLFELAGAILIGASAPAIRETAVPAGLAWAITGLLKAFPFHAARRKLYLPLDVLERHGVTRDDVFTRTDTPGLKAALAEVRGSARAELAKLGVSKSGLPAAALPAFLPLALVPPLLDRMDARNDPYAAVELAQWRRQWTLWRAARRGVF
jgi:phytoene synthase